MASAGPRDPPSNDTMDSKGMADDEPEVIPPLTTIIPAIFVPLNHSLLEPPVEPPTRTERLRRILENIDLLERGVKENLMWMFEREKKRILQEAKKRKKDDPVPEARPGVDTEEVDRMISMMSVPADPRVNYNMTEISAPNHNHLIPGNTSQEETVRQLMDLAERAISQLVGYGLHMQDARTYYLDRLQKEIETDQSFGMRADPGR